MSICEVYRLYGEDKDDGVRDVELGEEDNADMEIVPIECNKVSQSGNIFKREGSGFENKRHGGFPMENEKFMEMYLDKMNKDQSDLREDIRASEKRTAENTRSMEERMDKRVEQMLGVVQNNATQYEKKIDKLEMKIDNVVQKVEQSAKENRSFMWGIVFTIIIGIAAMVVAMCIGIAQIVSSANTTTQVISSENQVTQNVD